MPWLLDDIYHSSNGDTWQLLRQSPSGQILVRHTPAPSSGGRATEVAVEAFLAIDGPGPEFGALRMLLRKLARV